MEKTAVVLAGGGSRGAYQIGVWEALRESGEVFDIVTGTSVGALNGAMLVQGDYQRAKLLWLRLTSQDIANVELPEADEDGAERGTYRRFLRQAVKEGGVDVSGLERLMRQAVDIEKFYQSPVDFGLVTVRFPAYAPVTMAKSEIPPEKLCDYLIASASCFPAFPAKKIGSEQYIDGSFYDNMPINLALDLGATRIIAVDLEAVGLKKRPRQKDVPLTVIRPVHPLGPFLYFEPGKAGRNMRLGYLDALRALGRAEGEWLTFKKGEYQALREWMAPFLWEVSALLPSPFGEKLMEKKHFEDTVQRLGEWYELDIEALYTAHDFAYELLLRFNSQKEEPVSLHTGTPLLEGLKRQEHKRLVQFFFGRLTDVYFGRADGGETARIGAALRQELAAAIWVYALKSGLAREGSLPL